jgi:hypothetical protein
MVSPVRDDLHKGAPLPTHWSRVLRVLARDADWSASGPGAIETAVLRDLRELLGNENVRDLIRQLEHRQEMMFAPTSMLGRSPSSPLAERALDHLARVHGEGVRGREALKEAAAAALREQMAANTREMLAHVAQKNIRSMSEIARRMESAGRGMLEASLARGLDGVAPDKRGGELDLDNVDLRHGWSA